MDKYTMLEMGIEHQCAHIHADIKLLIPETDAQKLIEAGFIDCSYGNDECPSYYNPQFEADANLYAVDHTNDDFERISDKITYVIYHNARPFYSQYETIDAAIETFKTLK